MIKVMIVDDEKNFRDYLKMIIDWESYGFEVCCEAKNGLEALQKAEESDPDIILLDINMPKMDGLSLTGELSKLNKDISIILITGHDKFEYAQKAVRLGVFDYILKPFESQELVLTMLQLKDNIMKAYEETIESSNNEDVLKNVFINQYLTKQYEKNEMDLIEKMEKMQIFRGLNNVQVTVIEIDKLNEKWDNEEDKVLWDFAVKNILSEVVQPDGEHVILSDYYNRIVSIIDYGKTPNIADTVHSYNKFKQLIRKHLDFTVTIGIGALCKDYEGIRASYTEAVEALNYKYKLGLNSLYLFDHISKNDNKLSFYSVEWNEELVTYLRANDEVHVKNVLQRVFEFTRNEHMSMENIRIIHYVIVSLCLSYIAQTKKSASEILGEANNPYEEVDRRETAEEQRQWLVSFIIQIMDYYKNNKMTRSSQIAQHAKEYILNHYMNSELTIKDITQSVYINETYLRKMFVKEMGMSISEYITQVRMNKAKEHILSKKVKITDIAELVGYSYPGYFSRCFKKYYGISPSQYELMNTNTEKCK